jgi:pimeloyl-ACP methyl ester carboxylesterase
MPVPASEPFEVAEIWDGPVFYRQTQPSRATRLPLLLLHGWGGSSRYWRPTMAALGTDRRVIAPDLPGFGESPPLKGPATADRLAELVITFADAMGLEQFDLNGHSFCANVAVHVAARYPQRVRRLVLTCVSTFRSERERQIVEKIHHVLALWMALRRPWMARSRPFYRTVGSRFFYRLPADDTILRDAFSDFLKMEQRTALESAASAGDAIINPTMASLTTPTVAICARQDKIMPPAGAPEVARLIPDSRLFWIEKCGHLPMIEHPEQYNQIVRDFLDR